MFNLKPLLQGISRKIGKIGRGILLEWPMNSSATNALEWKSGFTKSVSLDDNPGSQRDTEPCLEVVNKKNWSLYLNSCSIKNPLLKYSNRAVIILIKRWVEGPWTFCCGFSLKTQSVLALLCLMHAPWALALYSVGSFKSFKNMVFELFFQRTSTASSTWVVCCYSLSQ